MMDVESWERHGLLLLLLLLLLTLLYFGCQLTLSKENIFFL